MLASLNFVEKFISLPKTTSQVNVNGKTITKTFFDTKKIEPILTRQGFEVESIRQFGGGFDTVVVGRIERFEQHPEANRLNVCFVNVNEGELRQIVCGARNVRKDMYVAVALPGTKLPVTTKAGESLDPAVKPRGDNYNPRGDNIVTFEIKPSVIRNVKSDGMLCARSELGLSINSDVDGDGIWDISDDAQGGAPQEYLEKHLGFPVFMTVGLEDTILELSVTPNRPDMLSQQGVARELAAGFFYNEIEFKTKCFDFSVNSNISAKSILDDVTRHATGTCGNVVFEAYNYIQANAFFVLLEMTQAQNKTPAWLRNLLEPLNQNSINLIVDISNFILVAYGQPNHTFDLDSIDAANPTHKKLIFRHAHTNESFTALDGKERLLHEADCVVSDSTIPQALLGVVGGAHSKITEKTKKIVVEFANPNPTHIRHTARRHSKQTVASFMFEKGIDVAARYHAAAEFVALFSHLMHHNVKYCSSLHSKDAQNVPIVQTDFQKIWLPLNISDQKKILGVDLVPFETQLNILNALGFETLPNNDAAMIAVPTWRSKDVVGTADLVEEFIRVVGIDHVPAIPMDISAVVNSDDSHLAVISKLCRQLCALGYHESVGLHFMREDDWQKLNLSSPHALGEPVRVLNPVIGDEPFLQTTLIPDLLRKVERNLNYGIKSGQLFYSARTFHKTTEERPSEIKTIAGVCFGQKTSKTWQNTGPQSWSLQDIMMHISTLAQILNVKIIYRQTESPFASALHPKKCISFFADTDVQTPPIGFLGELHPKVKRNYGLDNTDVYIFELQVEQLIYVSNFFTHLTKKSYSLPKFPLISRDFSFIFDEDITAENIKKCIQNALLNVFVDALSATVKSVQIFDIYRGEGVPENKKSVTLKVIVEPSQKTFTDHEIQKFSNCIIDALTTHLSAEQRT